MQLAVRVTCASFSPPATRARAGPKAMWELGDELRRRKWVSASAANRSELKRQLVSVTRRLEKLASVRDALLQQLDDTDAPAHCDKVDARRTAQRGGGLPAGRSQGNWRHAPDWALSALLDAVGEETVSDL